MDAKLLFEAKAQLGEGAIWNIATQELYWVDIEGKSFNVLNPGTLENKTYPTKKKVGTIVPVDVKTVLVALEDGIASIDLDSGEIEYKLDTDFHLSHNRRFNDGKCDSQGRFWVGTHSMSGVRGVSSLYCISSEFRIEEKITGVSISNGIVWTLDNSRMFYIDTPTSKVVQYDFDEENGGISSRREVITIPDGMGDPDGMAIDNEGMLWVALWDGFCVARFDPATGQLIERVNVPAPKVTSCAFGGENLSTLFITTASVEMTEEELKKYPLSGGIFTADVGVTGLPANKFNL